MSMKTLKRAIGLTIITAFILFPASAFASGNSYSDSKQGFFSYIASFFNGNYNNNHDNNYSSVNYNNEKKDNKDNNKKDKDKNDKDKKDKDKKDKNKDNNFWDWWDDDDWWDDICWWEDNKDDSFGMWKKYYGY